MMQRPQPPGAPCVHGAPPGRLCHAAAMSPRL